MRLSAVIALLILLPDPGKSLAERPASRARPALALPGQEFPARPESKPRVDGRFLIATRQVGGPFFAKSVVLLIQQDRQGAMGLILNRPSETPITELLAQQAPRTGTAPGKEEAERPEKLYVGGPVEANRTFFLVQTAEPLPRSVEILPGVYASSDSAVLEKFAQREIPPERFRAYVGYSGWGAGSFKQKSHGVIGFSRPPSPKPFSTRTRSTSGSAWSRNTKGFRFGSKNPSTKCAHRPQRPAHLTPEEGDLSLGFPFT